MPDLRRICPACGAKFERKHGTRREKCFTCAPVRTGANRTPLKKLAAVTNIGSPHRSNCICLDCVRDRERQRQIQGVDDVPRGIGEHERVVRAELEKLGWSDTMEGVGAIGLAISLDDRQLPGAQRTSLLKQLRDVVADIRAQAPREPDALDAYQETARRLRDGAR